MSREETKENAMACRLSVIIPNRNGEDTIGLCLEALVRSDHESFEIIVVDDCSTDTSVAIIRQFPCKLIRLKEHVGTAVARNIGAQSCSGALLFFTDADCLVYKDTLFRAERIAAASGPDTIIGGTYTCRPYDLTFYSMFQSVFIHFFELKNIHHPDYIAAHAMVITSHTFRESGGFPIDFLPIIEDVEFSHRLRKKGYTLIMEPGLQVRHNFGYHRLSDSMKNGYNKSKYWTIYSLSNRDLLADSGTASLELKTNVLVLFATLALIAVYFVYPNVWFVFLLTGLIALNLLQSRRLFSLFLRSGGKNFLFKAAIYYMFVYPFAVGAGFLAGILNVLTSPRSEANKQP